MKDWMKHFRIFLIVTGVLGAVAFFPFNFENNYTCLYHRLFCDMNPESQIEGSANHVHESNDIHNATLHIYLQRFSYFWWGSLLLLTLGIYWPRIMNLARSMYRLYAFGDDSEIKF